MIVSKYFQYRNETEAAGLPLTSWSSLSGEERISVVMNNGFLHSTCVIHSLSSVLWEVEPCSCDFESMLSLF